MSETTPVMKKDREIPVYLRIIRWALVILVVGFVANCYKNWFF